jgi:two-component system, LytTR family, response regulator
MIKCIAIDDEPLALELLEDFISKVPFFQLAGTFQNPTNAISLLHEQNVQLLFLDIQMPEITGLEFLKSLESKPKVIFTTAYSDYALEGFNHDAVDYLLKPFTFDRFLKACNKAYRLIAAQQINDPEKDYMFIKSGYDTVKIKFQDIQYVEGFKDYVKIHLKEGHPVLCLISMKALLEKLPANFIRVHRSFIIAFDKIKIIQRRQVKIGDTEVPIGDMYREAFFQMVEQDL